MSVHSTTAGVVVALHESEVRYPQAVDAIQAQASRRRELRPGHRWVVRYCPICRGWHLDQVRGAS